jgi:Mg-chelatase subunit ChlD
MGLVGRILVFLALGGWVASAGAQPSELQVEIQNIPENLLLTSNETSQDVEGRASIFGGMEFLDLFLILDASNSLNRTDPKDYRLQAAVALVRALPVRSDIQIGIVAFETDALLVSPLTTDRDLIVERLESIERDGGTNLHDGIGLALDDFDRNARPGSARIALLFTDGKSNRKKAIAAAERARDRGMVIHSLLLLDRNKSEDLLKTIAEMTRGIFHYVERPEDLPQAFRDLRTTGVDHVKLSVDGSPPIDTDFVAGIFRGPVPLRPGRNVITATATDLDGNTASHDRDVMVTGPLRVAIAQPIDGATFTWGETETTVEINASVFTNPTQELLASFPTSGIDQVEVSVSGGNPVPTEFVNGRFVCRLPLAAQGNRILATATSFDGRQAQAFVDVSVRSPGCSELRVSALRDGRPAISISDRGLEIIFDASGSMWGKIGQRTKIEVAKETLQEAMVGFPREFQVALRVYGHQYPRQEHNCEDSELLIPLGVGNSAEIRRIIQGFQPKGQTPLAYSIKQVPADFGDFDGGRSVVLITDGIESCDGNVVAAAEALQSPGHHRPVHVIGFGFEPGQMEALDSLRTVAERTGGRFIRAGDGSELRRALAATAGTPFSIWRGSELAGRGTLGAGETLRLPAGDYAIRLESDPPQIFPFQLGIQEALGLTLVREGDSVFTTDQRQPAAYSRCP